MGTITISKDEYEGLVRDQAFLKVILATADTNGYCSGVTVEAVKTVMGYSGPVATDGEPLCEDR